MSRQEPRQTRRIIFAEIVGSLIGYGIFLCTHAPFFASLSDNRPLEEFQLAFKCFFLPTKIAIAKIMKFFGVIVVCEVSKFVADD